jgi:hypothetical protein
MSSELTSTTRRDNNLVAVFLPFQERPRTYAEFSAHAGRYGNLSLSSDLERFIAMN